MMARPAFLGRASLVYGNAVHLGRVRLGTKMTITWRDITPPPDAQPPREGCYYMGARSFLSGPSVDDRIQQAKAAGYTEVYELDVPPCVPTDAVPCFVSGNSPSKYVWACQPVAAPGAKVPPTGAPPPAGPEAASAAPSTIPTTTALAIGGLTAAGIVAFLALR
jgi:hypothetical protein